MSQPVPTPPQFGQPLPQRPPFMILVIAGIMFLSGIGMLLSGIQSLLTAFGMLLVVIGGFSIVVARGLYLLKRRAYLGAIALQIVALVIDLLAIEQAKAVSAGAVGDITLTIIVCVILYFKRKRFVRP